MNFWDAWHASISALPWDWSQFAFMRIALLAVILASPLYALLGVVVVNNRMAFFSDTIGHASLLGVGLGVLLGLGISPWFMVLFAVLLASAIHLVQRATRASADTVIGVFMAISVALGIVLLSRNGQFSKFSSILIGDLLSITEPEVAGVAITLALVLLIYIFMFNRWSVAGLNGALARSRGMSPNLANLFFTAVLATVVTLNIRWVGVLVINSLLILPAAAARHLAKGAANYLFWTVMFSLLASISGLIGSYYLGTATGATIVLAAMLPYCATALLHSRSR